MATAARALTIDALFIALSFDFSSLVDLGRLVLTYAVTDFPRIHRVFLLLLFFFKRKSPSANTRDARTRLVFL